MRMLLLVFCTILYIPAITQSNLSGSYTGSIYKYIYRIDEDEARVVFKSNPDNFNEKFLHTLVDSFPANSNHLPSLIDGNYLIVYARGNKFYYDLKTVGDLEYKLVNNSSDLVIALHTRQGQLITNAEVYLQKRKISLDPSTQTYRLNKGKKSGTVRVSLNNVAYFFYIEKQNDYRYKTKGGLGRRIKNSFPLKYIFSKKRPDYYNRRYNDYFYSTTDYEKKFRGFMAFNKPIYKPGDTIKLKAYVMNSKGKPLEVPLLLRLTDRNFSPDTIISVVKPYRDGGYDYEFVISDSLDLDVDDDYLITLEEERSRKYNLDKYDGDLNDNEYASKRKVLMRGKFRVEDYELKSITFAARSDKKVHSRGAIASIFMKATDENDMAVMDGRVHIFVKPLPNAVKAFQSHKVFIPDTLWYHEMPLDVTGETKIELPDSIFPAASFEYEIRCTFLNTSNEIKTETLYQSFKGEKYTVVIRQEQDSLIADHFINGELKGVNAMLYSFNQRTDTLDVMKLLLPARIAVNPFARSYLIKTDSSKGMLDVHQTKGLVSASAFRTKDSISVQLINPYHLKVWYTLFAGKKIINRGYGDSLFFIDKVRTKKNYFVSLQYVFEDKIYSDNYSVTFQDKLLNIKVKQPEVIYPGQTATINLSVTGADGKDVQGADVTAFAFTKKFENASAPVIPYLGRVYPGRETNNQVFIGKDAPMNKSFKLNWERWSREMILDTIEFFKFLHPKTVYTNTESSKDSVTQLAPFVMIKGDIQPVHLIYIDEKPVFFSQSENLKRYSFKISEGLHRISMRTQNKSITLDSVFIPGGVKTFISVNGDTTTSRLHVQVMPDTLTTYEKLLWSRYMILVQNNFGENYTYIKQGDLPYLLNYPGRNFKSNIQLVGPLTYAFSDFVVKNKFTQNFEVEGAYQYIITKGLIKQKQLKNPYPFNKPLSYNTPAYNFRDFVLTEKEIDSLWQDYLDHRSATEDLFTNSALSKLRSGQLQINVAKSRSGEDLFIKNILLFRYDDPDFLRVYKGTSRDLGFVIPGNYRLFLLLKNDDYFIVDSLNVRKNGLNYFETGIVTVKTGDNTSAAIATIINSREINVRHFENGDLDQLKLTFNDKYVDTSAFGYVTTGQVKSDNGAPVPFAIITIKGTRSGISADREGYFRIANPQNAVLAISAIGYGVKEIAANDEFQLIILTPVKMSLEEVVVVAYGAQKRKELTGSISSISQMANALSGSVAGISVRGMGTNGSSATPLIILNGLPYSGAVSDIDPTLIGSMNIMDQSSATAIYGAMAANGVIIIVTKANAASAGNPNIPIANSLRKNFHDDAYWQPRLLTDAKGQASFKVTFPDDITNWRTFVIAMADKKRTGFAEGSIRSFKTVSGNLALPQFLVVGDSVNVIGKVLNYLSDSITVKRSFSMNDSLISERNFQLRNSRIDTFKVVAMPKDSIKFKYTIQKEDGYFDGEERTVPLFKPGSLETRGFFAALQKDTSLLIELNPALGNIKLYAEASLLPVMLEEIENIRNYEYLCNEQLASKLKALLLQKKVYAYLKKDFKADKNITEIITRLDQSKSRNLWGWWSNNDPLIWISLHVIEALVMAEQNGYKTNLNKLLVTDYLVYNMESYKGSEKLLSLEILQALKAKVNYKGYIDSIERKYVITALYEKLQFLNIRQNAGMAVELEDLIAKGHHTMFGNIYWGEENYHFFDNGIQNTLLMYKLLKKSGKYDAQLAKIRNYFLEKRKDGKWRNTYESSLILETILPDLLINEAGSTPASLTISGSRETQVTSFPFSMDVNGGEKLKVSKHGSLPVYFTAYQQLWNPRPEKIAGDFEIQSVFKKGGQQVTMLKAGEPVQLIISVTVKSDADYVMLEIPIPAGCSYQDKNQSHLNNEVHREYFKNKTSIFCRELKKGNYTFVVSLLPRYTGNFQLNPSKVEMMYFPVFFGREAMKKVKIF